MRKEGGGVTGLTGEKKELVMQSLLGKRVSYKWMQ
jgi:hypothetical protein